MRLLALDPSSQRTGYAVMDGLRAADLVEFGYLNPRRRKDKMLERINAMVFDALAIVEEMKIEAAVIEITSGKVGRRHGGAGAGLAVYGLAVGAMWAALVHTTNMRVETVLENVWTQSKSKARRLAVLRHLYPAYDRSIEQDPGGDAGDAIGIGRWWFEEHSLVGAKEAAPKPQGACR